MNSSNKHKIRSPEKLEEDMRDILWAAAAGAGLYGVSKAWTKFGRDAVAALPFATKKMKAAAAQRKIDKADEKDKDKETIAKGKALGYDKDEDGIIIKPGDAEKYKKNAGKAPEGWVTDKEGKLTRKEQSRVPEKTMTITESNELQAIMALDDAGIKAEINRKGEVSVKKKDLKKAQKELKKSFKKGGEPKLVGEEVEIGEGKKLYYSQGNIGSSKYSISYHDGKDKHKDGSDFYGIKLFKSKREHDKFEKELLSKGYKYKGVSFEEFEIDEKFAGWIAFYGGKKLEIKKSEADGIWPAKQLAFKHFKVPKSKQGLLAIAPAEEGFESIDERMQESAYDKIKRIRNKLNEGIDAHAARELKLYIENDSQLYRSTIVPIIKNVQRKMKKGTYDHAKAPKLWMYLVDYGAKKYVKEFGGDVKRDFPKDLRLSIANEFAIEYKAEIDIQGGDML
jgi:hypothetical protein